jgi:hypothetical protein
MEKLVGMFGSSASAAPEDVPAMVLAAIAESRVAG